MTQYEVSEPIISSPFEAGRHGHLAAKVIDDRGNELLVVKDFKEAEE